ncbi:hypothetical protein ELI49_01040 [Rhizobium ruizarguesonis]|nr:hypothetical protein ELI49_01040 [Rhizobium ruizarguesonis]TAW75905.1 hypothetical protein ELI10_01035 [Rhizobium ruizarguesonis]TAX12860.1 hypothetical protein ELI09_01045 [Rhizobium ruizarguesonis]TAX17691.1 hypothetical protein ELI08_01035 [Rhizobium ruizarguesonis]
MRYERLVGNGEVATRPLRPAKAGRRCRQADEGQASAIPQEPGVEDVSGPWRRRNMTSQLMRLN